MEFNREQEIFIIVLTIAFLATLYILLFGPGGHFNKEREKEAKRLERKITIGGGIEIIDDFISLARVYTKLNRLTEADTTMKKALAIAENEYGKNSREIIPILKKYASVLNKCGRSIEAKNLHKRAREIASQK